MFNFIVDDREEAPGHLKAGGAEISGEIEKFEYGLFGWFVDPDGNKVEL
jgi:predicted enzyme related to lactoylglutathione lyase